MKRTTLTVLALVVAVFLGGCPKKGGGGGEVKTTKGGEGGVAAGGAKKAEIDEKAKETFRDAVDEFEKRDAAKDWGDAACKQVASMFEDASKEQPSGLPMAIFNAGLAYKRCGNDDAAKSLFKQALQMDPNYSSPRVMLANYAHAEGNVTQAEKMYQDAIKGAPLALETVEAYVNLAQIQRTRPAPGADKTAIQKTALDNLRRALAIDAQSMPAFTEMAYLYLDMAEKDKNKLTLAEVVCVQAAKIDAGYAPLYNVWGLLKMRQGEIIDALKYFEKAYSLDDKMFEAFMNFGSITIGFRGYEDARNAFARALELNPKSYDAVINLAVARRGLEDFDGAEQDYLKALELDKTRPDAYFNLGVLYQDYRLDKAGDSGFDNFQTAIKWYGDFKTRAGAKKEYEEYVKEADSRIADSQNAINLIKEAAQIMKEAEKLQKEADEAAKKEAAQPKPPEAAAPPAAEGGPVETPAPSGGGAAKAEEKKAVE